MESVFLHLVNMSITAGWLVLAVLLFRLVFHKAPRWIHCVLWALVAVRLLCPISIESDLSVVPSAGQVPVASILEETAARSDVSAPDTDVPVVNPGTPVGEDTAPTVTPDDPLIQPPTNTVMPVVPSTPAETVTATVPEANPINAITWVDILTWVWLAGMAAMLLYAVIATLRLKWRVRESVRLWGDLYQCDRIDTPFILGVVRPRIYLPTSLSHTDAISVVAHERAHLRRRDHWWKPLGFVLLAVYWFNPLLWMGYILLCRDIEAACDEKVIRDMDVAQRKAYSETILACSAPRHLVAACPVAFGETAVKSRIKAVLNYKKPAFWLVLVAVIASGAVAVCLLTNPKTTAEKEPTDDAVSVSDGTEGPAPNAEKSLVEIKDPFVWDCGYLGEEAIQSMYTDKGTQYSASNLPILVLRNTADFEQFIKTYHLAELDATGDFTTETGEIAQMRERYTDAYFADAVVLAVYYEGATYMYSPEIVTAQYSDSGKELTVLADVYEPSFVNDAMGGWFMLASIDRATAERITTYTAAVRAEIPEDSYIASFEKSRTMAQLKNNTVRETWRAWLSTEEWDALYAMVQSLGWGSHSGKAQDSPYVGAINLSGETYYVNSDFDMLCTKKRAANLTTEQAAFLRELYDKPRENAVGPVPYHPVKDNGVDEESEKPVITKENTWQTLGHPMPYEEASKVSDGRPLEKYNIEKLQQFLGELEWYSDTAPAADQLFDAYFSLDGVKRYYVCLDTWGDSGYLYDGERYATLPEEQVGSWDFLLADGGSTIKATHVLYGYFAEWNKAERLFVLDVAQADDAALVGKKIRVNTQNLYGSGLPYIGRLLMATYDGAVLGNTVYAKSLAAPDEDTLNLSTAPSEQNGTITGKVIYVTDKVLLLNCYDKEQFDVVWVRYGDKYPELNPQMNEEYQVVFNGQTMETYPPQVMAQTMTRVSSPPLNNGFISEERAIEIAVDHWKVRLDEPDMESGYYTTVYVMERPTADNPRYIIGDRKVDVQDGEPQNSALFNTLYIDAVSGKVSNAVSDAPALDTNFITETRAIEIASKYWKIQPGDRDPDTGYVMSIIAWETPTSENPHYRMALRWLVEVEGGTGNFSTVDTIYVHAVTGEIALPDGTQPGEGPEMESPDQE